MKVALNCSKTTEGFLMKLLSARSIAADHGSSLCIVESGCAIPKDKISIVFDMGSIGQLIELLDKFSAVDEENMDSVVGRNANDGFELIPLEQIHYFEARGNYVYCLTASREYKMKEKLYELESKMPMSRFIRVGKSYIVNINSVKEIIPWFGRRLMLRFNNSKKEIEVSKSYVKSVKEFLGL